MHGAERLCERCEAHVSGRDTRGCECEDQEQKATAQQAHTTQNTERSEPSSLSAATGVDEGDRNALGDEKPEDDGHGIEPVGRCRCGVCAGEPRHNKSEGDKATTGVLYDREASERCVSERANHPDRKGRDDADRYQQVGSGEERLAPFHRRSFERGPEEHPSEEQLRLPAKGLDAEDTVEPGGLVLYALGICAFPLQGQPIGWVPLGSIPLLFSQL